MVIKLYGRAPSPFVRVALLALFEKGVENFEVVEGDQKTPEYLATINPFGKHPALEIDGFILYESRAIARFVATKFESQGPNLLGSTPEEKALVDQWVEVEGHTFHPLILQINVERVFKPFFKQQGDEAVVEENCTKLEKVLDIYEAQLAKTKYLAGDFYSMADLVHIPMLYYFVAKPGKESLLTSRKHVNAWWEDISSRPAWLKVLEKYPSSF